MGPLFAARSAIPAASARVIVQTISSTTARFGLIDRRIGHLDRVPGHHAEFRREVIDRQIALMQELGIWKAPSGSGGPPEAGPPTSGRGPS
jgi:hypothetical protein